MVDFENECGFEILKSKSLACVYVKRRKQRVKTANAVNVSLECEINMPCEMKAGGDFQLSKRLQTVDFKVGQ